MLDVIYYAVLIVGVLSAGVILLRQFYSGDFGIDDLEPLDDAWLPSERRAWRP